MTEHERCEAAIAAIEERLAAVQRAEITHPGPWSAKREIGEDLHFGRMEFTEVYSASTERSNLFAVHGLAIEVAEFIAANHPAHVRAVLEAALATLREHRGVSWHDGQGRCFLCFDGRGIAYYPCPSAEPWLDIYAPEPT